MGNEESAHEQEEARPRDVGVSPSGSGDGSGEPVGDQQAARAGPEAGTTQHPAAALDVSFFHGSFDRSDFPVLVGHQTAMPVSGAEGFADRQFDGRLSERLSVDRYPTEIGESLFVRAPRRRHPSAGVIVVGLGEYGDLTELRLIETIRAALVRHALDAADDDEAGGMLDLGISTVLVGSTGDHGLRISGSLRGIVSGVFEANRDLNARFDSARARYSKLQVWEWNASDAELAMRALRAPTATSGAPQQATHDDLRVSTVLIDARGALVAGAPSENTEPAWWHVSVHCSDDPTEQGDDPGGHLSLEYSVRGRLARTGSVTHRVERRTLDRLLRRAVGTSRPDPGVHTTLFELLFPKQLKWDLIGAQHIQLEVDDTTADIPWEMLSARNPNRGTRGQLALRAPLVRRLRLPDMPTIRRSTAPRALVIGNPPLGAQGQPLPGAYREALAVSEVLESHPNYAGNVRTLAFDVDEQPDDVTTIAIETALFDDDYRIIHIAAHGLLDPDNASRTGVAIGSDAFVTATTFRQLNITPDLVFLNCCHLATVDVESSSQAHTRTHFNQLGASLARQLVDSGVRAVVVAGWAVDDAAAESFARTFYTAMLQGGAFGQATHEARKAAHGTSPAHSTWGAYQCYGDRGYTLPTSNSGARNHAATPPTTLREARRRIEILIGFVESSGAASAAGPHGAAAQEELRLLADTARSSGWIDDGAGRFCEEIGRAWAALGHHEQAISWLEEGLAASGGAMTLRGVEDLVNLKDRFATALIRRAGASEEDQARAEVLNAHAEELIELLERLSNSGERIALRAGHLKRRATTAITDRGSAVALAAEAYRSAYEHAPVDYTLLNYISLEEIRCRIAGEPSRATDLYPQLDLAVNRSRQSSTSDYWTTVGHADGSLTQAIRDDALPECIDRLVDLYNEAFDSRSTAGQRQSTLDNFIDLADLHPGPAASKALRTVHARLLVDAT